MKLFIVKHPRGDLIHVDGKKEFALGPGRVPVLVDSFGTLDEDRWWASDDYENGNIVSLSKEFVRSIISQPATMKSSIKLER